MGAVHPHMAEKGQFNDSYAGYVGILQKMDLVCKSAENGITGNSTGSNVSEQIFQQDIACPSENYASPETITSTQMATTVHAPTEDALEKSDATNALSPLSPAKSDENCSETASSSLKG